MRLVWEYIGSVFREGIGVWEGSQNWLARVVLLATCLFVPIGGQWILSLLQTPLPEWAVVGGGISLFLVVAPYRAWSILRTRVEVLEEAAQPKLSLRFVVRTSPKGIESAERAQRRWIELEVTNESATALQDVCAKIAQMTNVGGVDSDYENQPFAIKGQSSRSAIDLNPLDRACFEIAQMEENQPSPRFAFLFPEKRFMMPPLQNFPHTLTIRVTARNTAKQERKVRFSVPDGIMKFEELAAESTNALPLARKRVSLAS